MTMNYGRGSLILLIAKRSHVGSTLEAELHDLSWAFFLLKHQSSRSVIWNSDLKLVVNVVVMQDK